ncbi:MAG: serine/threonine protein kinase [Deltaproteobacteria bacterium]|nr:serine/threonine protein kinase [Deltaproteobacteria bacterium]MDQ3298340.1 serine/threonine protein kinase [Myxococcota bacterium]
MIGTVLGNYRVTARLGAGGMGTVWTAEHQLLGSRAAIKVLLPEMSVHPKIVQRFFDEARAATRIQDPGIVTVLDFGWHEQSAYLVMEHLSGETMADRVARLHLVPPLQAMRLLQQCAIAMAAAHARGIVHRDLKPDNIFLVADAAVTGGERIKILDFGIAKLIDDGDPGHSHTKTGMIMGTPAFMSPEQCRGSGGVDHRTDIYALGCVLFVMLCGRPPFVEASAGDMIASHLRQPPPVPSSIVPNLSADVDALVLRCLEKEPERRFQTMTELVRAASRLTGDHLAIETIAPLRATTREPITTPAALADATRADVVSETAVSHAAIAAPVSNTTLGNSTGQSSSGSRPWRGGLVVALAAIAVGGALTFVVTRDPTPARSAAPIDSAPPVAMPVDAGVAVTADAGESPPDAAKLTRSSPVIRTGSGRKPTGSTVPRAGSSAGSGSAYDPYNDR